MHGVSELLFEATPAAVAHGHRTSVWARSATGAPGRIMAFAFNHHIIIRFDPALASGEPGNARAG
jgi:hypothetical protein